MLGATHILFRPSWCIWTIHYQTLLTLYQSLFVHSAHMSELVQFSVCSQCVIKFTFCDRGNIYRQHESLFGRSQLLPITKWDAIISICLHKQLRSSVLNNAGTLTCLSNLILVLWERPINCDCQYLTRRWRCQQKPSVVALLQSGTHCHLTVARLSSPAHSDEAC